MKYSHRINQRCIAFKAMGNFFADQIQEIIKWNAEDKDL